MKEKEEALKAKFLYNRGAITREEAVKMISPYKEIFNQTSKRLAAQYGQKQKLFSMAAFLR